MPLIEFVSLNTLRLEPDEIVVLSTELTLRPDQAAQIRERLIEQIGTQNKVLVLSMGLKLSTLTRAEIEAWAR